MEAAPETQALLDEVRARFAAILPAIKEAVNAPTPPAAICWSSPRRAARSSPARVVEGACAGAVGGALDEVPVHP